MSSEKNANLIISFIKGFWLFSIPLIVLSLNTDKFAVIISLLLVAAVFMGFIISEVDSGRFLKKLEKDYFKIKNFK